MVCQIGGLQTWSQQPLRPQLRPQPLHFSFFASLSISESSRHSNVTGVHWDHFPHSFFVSLVGIAEIPAVGALRVAEVPLPTPRASWARDRRRGVAAAVVVAAVGARRQLPLCGIFGCKIGSAAQRPQQPWLGYRVQD